MNNHQIEKLNCLLLNVDFTPLKIVSWRKSIVWSLRSYDDSYSIEIIEYYKDKYIQGISTRYPVPLIARRTSHLNLYNKPISFSRKNVYIRDNYTCQYCGQKFITSELTYDHVIPKSKFKGKRHSCTNWHNVVTACVKCNFKKANRTPQEANMELIKAPIQPKYSADYLPWTRDTTIIDSTNQDFFEACSIYIR